MLLGEPPRTQADLNFSLLGIPVRVHPMFWLVALLLGFGARDAASILIWIGAVFVGVLVHELGHALTIRAFGMYPWITLYSFGGLASYDQRSSIRSAGMQPLGQVLISLAGPAAGFLLAALLLLGVWAAGYGETMQIDVLHGHFPAVLLPNAHLTTAANLLLFVCIAWGVLNLLPIYPLDGGQVAREVLLQLNPREGIRLSLQLSIVVAIAVAVFGLYQWRDIFIALLFGFLAFSNFTALQAYRFRGPW